MGNDQLYIKGFNSGFLLAEYRPELLSKLLQHLALSNEYVIGVSDGRNQYKLEHDRAEFEEIARLREQSINKDYDRRHE